MTRDPVVLTAADIRIIHNPWPALTTGLVLAAASALWFLITKHAAPALAFFGLLASGAAITIRPRSSLILGLAGLSGIFAWLGLQWDLSVGGTDWDSGRALVAVLTGLAFLAGVLALVPRVVRRVAISLLVIFHFGGILTAVTNIPPNPWMSNMAWTHVYRPYLEFFYLGNAYHFYSPDPGPGTQLWFYAQFEDGKIQD